MGKFRRLLEDVKKSPRGVTVYSGPSITRTTMERVLNSPYRSARFLRIEGKWYMWNGNTLHHEIARFIKGPEYKYYDSPHSDYAMELEHSVYQENGNNKFYLHGYSVETQQVFWNELGKKLFKPGEVVESNRKNINEGVLRVPHGPPVYTGASINRSTFEKLNGEVRMIKWGGKWYMWDGMSDMLHVNFIMQHDDIRDRTPSQVRYTTYDFPMEIHNAYSTIKNQRRVEFSVAVVHDERKLQEWKDLWEDKLFKNGRYTPVYYKA